MVVHRIKNVITGEYYIGSGYGEYIGSKTGKMYMREGSAQKALDKLNDPTRWILVKTEIKDI